VADFDIRRRSAGGDGGTTLFRSVRSDEDGGKPANIAATRSEQSNRIARAAVCTNERAARLRYSRQSALQLAASK
jgi:hypothetical protein